MLKGIVANIQRCSVHDGPGIRTTVFLKGCNMRCAWCHNPETISFAPEELLHPEKCIHCGLCDQGCFSGARVVCGVEMTVEETLEEVLKDRPYYGEEGGLTLSGGEPMCQPDFAEALLSAAKAAGIHTAIESNLNCQEETMRRVTRHCGLVMADLKIFDESLHRRYTGAGNQAVLRNLPLVRAPLIVRTPVIQGINDREEEIVSIARFAGGIPSLLYYELLPYHPLGLSKGAGRQERFSAPGKERMRELALLARPYCPQVRIAGKVIA